jgi:hypothetical protein
MYCEKRKKLSKGNEDLSSVRVEVSVELSGTGESQQTDDHQN